MFGSNVLEVLIGLIVIFLAVGLAVTAGTELISHWMSMRPEQLKKALVGMLDGTSSVKPVIPEDHWFFSQTLVRSMADWGKEFPSYMDRKTFSEALLLAIDKDYASKSADQLTQSLINSLQQLNIKQDRKELIANYLREANGDMQKFRALVESWFDRVMDRATGWYKRNVANVAFGLSAVIVVAANIDTLAIANALCSPELRAKAMEAAIALTKYEPNAGPAAGAGAGDAVAGAANPPATDATAAANTNVSAGAANAPATHPAAPANANVRAGTASAPATQSVVLPDKQAVYRELDALQAAGLPLGWSGALPRSFADWLRKIIGLLITICAASLGAPFWFDMLSKLVNIRAAGPKPVNPTKVTSPRAR